MTRLLPILLFPGIAAVLPGQAPSGGPPAPAGLPEPVGGEIPAAEREELREPLTVFVEGGRDFTGTLADIDAETLSLRIIQDGGEIVLSFPREEVREIFFPGERIFEQTNEMVAEGNLRKALPYLESLLAQRYRLFDLLPQEERSPFAAVPMAALSIDRPAAAIAYVEALRPYLGQAAAAERLDTAELLARYILDLDDEARRQALAWIEADERFGDSALGYFVLAALRFEGGDYEGALDVSLRPVVFSGQLPMAYLPHCYTLAIASTHLLGNDGHREQLLAELRERGLSWQPLRALRSAPREDLEDLVVLDGEGNPLPLFEATTGDERLLESMEESVGTGNFIDPSALIPL